MEKPLTDGLLFFSACLETIALCTDTSSHYITVRNDLIQQVNRQMIQSINTGRQKSESTRIKELLKTLINMIYAQQDEY